jgi:hypothetical protein
MSWNEHGGGRKYVHITETPDVRHITNPDVMHEESDVDVKGVGTFVGILFAGLIVMAAMMIGLFKAFEKYAEYQDARIAVTPMARTEKERLPPAPRLQASKGFQSLDPHDPNDPNANFELKEPAAEWNALHEKWNEELKSAATDQTGQTTRVPIDDAKRMLLEKGLPVRPNSDPGNVDITIRDVPSYSSAGRQPQKREVWAGTGTLNTLPEKQPNGSARGASDEKH